MLFIRSRWLSTIRNFLFDFASFSDTRWTLHSPNWNMMIVYEKFLTLLSLKFCGSLDSEKSKKNFYHQKFIRTFKSFMNVHPQCSLVYEATKLNYEHLHNIDYKSVSFDEPSEILNWILEILIYFKKSKASSFNFTNIQQILQNNFI